jgi:hypothetical protein
VEHGRETVRAAIHQTTRIRSRSSKRTRRRIGVSRSNEWTLAAKEEVGGKCGGRKKQIFPDAERDEVSSITRRHKNMEIYKKYRKIYSRTNSYRSSLIAHQAYKKRHHENINQEEYTEIPPFASR